MLKEQGEAQNALLITQTQAQVDGLKKQQTDLENTKTNPRFRDIFSLLGITDGMNDEQLKAFQEGIGRIKQAIQETTDALIQESQARIQQLDTEISAKQQEVDKEADRNKQGYANNLSIRQKELADLQEQKRKEEQIRRNALTVQRSVDLASAVSSGIVTSQKAIEAAVTAFAESQKLGPIVGIIAGLAAVATVIATVINIKSKIKALSSPTQLREGGRIPLDGRTHEQGGHHILGTDIEVERGEHVVNARSSERYDKTLEAINKNNPHYALQMLLKESGIGLPPVIVEHIHKPGFNAPVQQAGMSDKQFKELIDTVKEHVNVSRQHMNVSKEHAKKTPEVTVNPIGDGWVIEQDGSRTHTRQAIPGKPNYKERK